jgi:modification methylase
MGRMQKEILEKNKMLKNTIIEGDVLEKIKDIPSLFINLTVTSPPYNKTKAAGGSEKSIMNKIIYDSFDDDLPEEEYQEQQIFLMNELYRITKEGGSLFYNHKVRHLKGFMIHPMEWVTKTKWHLRQEIIWNRNAPVEVGGYRFYQIDERIYWLYKPIENNVIGTKLLSKHARLKSVWDFTPDRNNSHPAPFPLELPLRCILSILDDKEGIVFDPYMGSGTTAVAATLLKKEWLGIDISKTYIKEALKRISKAESEKHKLNKELSYHIVTKSYKERKKIFNDDFF